MPERQYVSLEQISQLALKKLRSTAQPLNSRIEDYLDL